MSSAIAFGPGRWCSSESSSCSSTEEAPRDEAALGSLSLRRLRHQGEEDSATYLVFGGGTKQYPSDRIEVLARGLPDTEEDRSDDHVLDWSELDEEIEKRLGLREDPDDTPFNYSFEYDSRTAAEQAVEDLRARGFHVELGGTDGSGEWFVSVASDVENGAAERELQRYAKRTEGLLYLP